MRRAFFVVVGVAGVAGFFACKPRQDGAGSDVKTNATNPNETALDVNDLSYLLPLNAAGQVYPTIKVASSWSDARAANRLMPFDEGGTTPILTKPVYDSIVAATADQQNFGQTPKSLKTPFKADEKTDFEHEAFVITSFRIDPCAPSLALDKARTNYQNPLSQTMIAGLATQLNQEIADIFGANKFTLAACQTQLRLILQPVSADGKQIKESTVHMVYTLNAGAGVMNDTLQADVQGLKKKLQEVTGVDTTGYLLQPHPGLASEAAGNQNAGSGGPGAQALVDYLSSLLHKYTNSQVMAVIREKVVGGVQYDVVLGGGVSDPRETAAYTAGPLVGSSAKKGFIIMSDGNRRTWRMDPQPTRNNPVFDNLITFDADRIDTPQDSALLNMMKKDDPESTHFFVNDCVTCHGTSQAFKELRDPTIAATSAPRYKVPPGVSGFPIGSFLPPAPRGAGQAQGAVDEGGPAKGSAPNKGDVVGVALRNFGYSHGQPVIGLRTVTETAALADYFNRDLRRINNPGAVCNGPAEEKAWIAAIGMGSSEANPAYVFTKGKGAREDALFAAAGCTTKIEGTAALGTRGDGANTPKVGPQQSPIFSQMSFEGQGTGGPMTLTLAKMGQAVMSQQQGTNAPELTIGTWTYVADANRISQIKVTMDGNALTLGMTGTTLCEVPAAGDKPRLNGCLSLQSGWAKAAKVAQQATVEFFANADCSGSPAFKAGPFTDCSKVPKANITTVRLDGQTCLDFASGAPVNSPQACKLVKAGGSSAYNVLFRNDSCEAKFLVAVVSAGSNCSEITSSTSERVWAIQPKGGKCKNIEDLNIDDGCAANAK